MMKYSEPKEGPRDLAINQHRGFEPYEDNGGNVIALTGDDYLLIASDLRLSSGYEVLTRNQSKIFKVNEKVYLGSTGCWCDCLAFNRVLEIRAKMYEYDHNKELSHTSAAELVQKILYGKRFFPYYVTNIVAGIDEQGKGHVYHYDPVGSFERLDYTCAGSATTIIQPFLDNQFGKKNVDNLTPEDMKIPLDKAIQLCKDAFITAAEREITCGDGVKMFIITKNGTKEENFSLRKD